MQNLLQTFGMLSPQRRMVLVLAILAVVASTLWLGRIASAPRMAVLYSGLEPAAAGEILQSLEQRGSIYEIRGGAILVDAAERDQLRLTLAAEGKPANGPVGYELLDSLTGFGTTSQMFDAAYWRAKEGELARTIMSSPTIRSARVHISDSGGRPFARDAALGASIAVVPAGAILPPAQAQALRHLVASAVAGLEPEEVSVIDARAGRVIGADDPGLDDAGDQRAAELRRRAERLLEAVVGPGNAVVEVSVSTATEREQIVERRLDPDSRVMISSDTEERSAATTDTRNGDVTVASNLPDGDASASGANSSSDTAETRERVNYEVSETTREVLRVPGAVERITVAVLVNEEVLSPDGSGEAPRLDSDTLRGLVASAVGFDEGRGDVVTVALMPFGALNAVADDMPAPALLDALGLDVMRLVQIAALSLVALVLGLFVVRPILTRPQPLLPGPGALPSGPAPSGLRALAAPGGTLAMGTADLDRPDRVPGNARRLAEGVTGRQADAASVLRNWMSGGVEAE